MHRVAVVPGDGIGPEVLREAVRVLEAAARRYDLSVRLDPWDHLGAERWLAEGVGITEEEFRRLEEEYDAILLGALGDPRVPDEAHAREILLGLRGRLDLYLNFRPCRLLDPAVSPLRRADEVEIRIEIFRENTEGLYGTGGGTLHGGTPDEVAIQHAIHTRKGVERIVRAAFLHAREHGRPGVTLVDKANALRAAGDLWRRTFAEVGDTFPDVPRDAIYVDAAAMDLVRRPERYAVVVTSNLFGDVLSDLAAEITGGIGLAPSANLHPGRHALFEPVHGSAPDIAGSGRANPLAAVRCVGLLLEHLGHAEAALAVERAAAASVEAGVTTPDLGGTRSTEEVGEWIAAALDGR